MPFSDEEIATYKQQFEADGFVVVPGLIAPGDLPELRRAADAVTERARAFDWKQVRMVGKQFPPWTEGDDVWGVQNLMHPGLAEPVFAQWYGSQDLVDVSAGLMGVSAEDMQFELFNLLVNPLRKDYALTWHRDDVKANASAEAEAAALAVKHYGIQWNAALYDDACLSAVPGSHARLRTPDERAANLGGGDMPGGQVVGLRAGETVFYNNNILHVGKYNLDVKRRTLHGCYGCPPAGDTTRARNILQHDLAYTSDEAWRATLPEKLQPMVAKLNDMRARMAGKEIEYSQDA